ncbi:hypothetical protein HDV05_002787 [Chytridiales sp. JEL 0842]|nr:hypothetical protein HDV05_002787 [Chytridiales sp. JEL 0842]
MMLTNTVSKAATFVLLSIFLPSTLAQSGACTATGTTVNVGGYIMDNLCIDLGTLLDNPSVKTLQNPQEHTIHCLIDVKSCVNSGYAILEKIPDAPADAEVQYRVKYQLGQEGTQTLITLLGEARTNGVQAGYLANLTGVDDGSGTLKCVRPFGGSSVVVGGASGGSSGAASATTVPAASNEATTSAAGSKSMPTATAGANSNNGKSSARSNEAGGISAFVVSALTCWLTTELIPVLGRN